MHPAFGTRAVEYNPKIIFTVNILEALDNKISIPLIARLFGFSFGVVVDYGQIELYRAAFMPLAMRGQAPRRQ